MPKKVYRKKKNHKNKKAMVKLPNVKNDYIGSLKRFHINQNYRVKQIVDFNYANTVGGTTYPNIAIQLAGADAAGAVWFNMDMLDGLAAFTGLFDQYRVVCYAVRFIPLQNIQGDTAAAVVGISNIPGRLYTCLDHDDVGVSTLALMRQDDSCIETNFGKELTRYVKPQVSMNSAYNQNTTSTGKVLVKSPWVNLATTNVIHAGLKWAINRAGAGSTAFSAWAIEVEAYVEFREPQ